MAKFAFNINGKYHEVGPFESPVHAAHFLRQQHPGKTLEHVELREPDPDHRATVKEDKTVATKDIPVPTPEVATDEPASTSSPVAD